MSFPLLLPLTSTILVLLLSSFFSLLRSMMQYNLLTEQTSTIIKHDSEHPLFFGSVSIFSFNIVRLHKKAKERRKE